MSFVNLHLILQISGKKIDVMGSWWKFGENKTKGYMKPQFLDYKPRTEEMKKTIKENL
jgi:hypothetical protein